MIAQRTLLTAGQLFLLALAALFAATTVNGFIASRLERRPAVRLSEAPPAPRAQAKKRVSWYAPITEKDIFNPPKPPEPQAAAVQVSDLKAKLLGTAPSEGGDSFCVIEDQTTKKQDLYRVGDRFQNRSVARIEWDRVFLKNGPNEEMLTIAERTTMPGAPEPAAATAAAGITQRGENEFVIDRTEVDKAMENLNQLFTQVRAVPHFQDGKAAGFRLFAIRRDSIFDKIGLKNGDIIKNINGNELTDPARAMSLIQELRNEGRIAVDVTRNREPATLNYEIR